MLTPGAVIELLRNQVGRESALKAPEIVEIVTNQRSNINAERNLREIVKVLCLEGWPICSSSYHGYWWAGSVGEVEEVCGALHSRAVSSLARIGKLKRVAIPILAGQMTLPLDCGPQVPDVELHDYTQPVLISKIVEIPEPLHLLVQKFLDAHPDWGEARVLTEALTLFLLEQGHAGRN
jgi:hypothetical protein